MNVSGKYAVPKKGAFILTANHVSNLDPIVLGSACPRKLYFIAKRELFKNSIFSSFFNAIQVVPLEREKPDFRLMRRALKILKEKPLLIFPQGSRTKDYNNFKSGAGFLYKKSLVPVIAAKISGTDTALPKNSNVFHLSRIKVVFSRVSSIKESDTYKEIARKIMDKIRNM